MTIDAPHAPKAAAEHGSPLKDASAMVQCVAAATGRAPADVERMLREEFANPGITVAQEFQRRGLTPYVFTDGLERFYSESDAFIIESAVWNRNRIKRAMRQWISRYLQRMRIEHGDGPLDVLCIGDGLGFDSAQFADDGHRVTYHEVPGPNERFARLLFERTACNVRILTDRSQLDDNAFDVVVCLDVLEHVPDPPAMVASLLPRLRSNGRMIVHAPFYMIHPAYPTHLKSNRVHSGSTRLYAQNGLRVVGGRAMWNPLVLQRSSSDCPALSLSRRLMLLASGAYLALGRRTSLPMRPIHFYRCVRSRWFG